MAKYAAHFSLQNSEKDSNRNLMPTLKLQLWDESVWFTLHGRNAGFINPICPTE